MLNHKHCHFLLPSCLDWFTVSAGANGQLPGATCNCYLLLLVATQLTWASLATFLLASLDHETRTINAAAAAAGVHLKNSKAIKGIEN